MPQITRETLMTLEAYAKAREAFRARVLAHKSARTVHLGEHVTLVFEDELTMRYQIQEMLRIEKTFEEAGIQDELDAYNPLVPDGSNFKATMLIEYEDVDERKARAGDRSRASRIASGCGSRASRTRLRDRRRGPGARKRREDLRRALPALRADPRDDRGAEARRRAGHRRRPSRVHRGDSRGRRETRAALVADLG